jgi:Bacterial pre-peptidase C-terminal domain
VAAITAVKVSQYQPSSSGFSYGGGTLKGVLSGPGSADFDLYLQRLSGSTWSTVARSEGATASETINYAAGAGTYRWRVYSYAGTGSYTLEVTR